MFKCSSQKWESGRGRGTNRLSIRRLIAPIVCARSLVSSGFNSASEEMCRLSPHRQPDYSKKFG